jgi:hypothetical protein
MPSKEGSAFLVMVMVMMMMTTMIVYISISTPAQSSSVQYYTVKKGLVRVESYIVI